MRLLVLFCFLMSLGTLVVHAQPSSGGPAPQTPQAPTDVPLDGGASLLLAGGVAYGLRRLRQRRVHK
ncbi:hypothetical protein Q5H92_19870 [Hymenobacter sp. M29]|uniref:VPDSG-CTERM protein sorting domain-containing protein n=1 Tax=Hymenobacter mellowenesis TaxID=3063995 RepID=A0ABT9AFN1_9BACT|nr:hypothetical protein [Hymenobacter sp. M29]MDO7848634.1 hypothetical protein [Hymenobacter sp. M29]